MKSEINNLDRIDRKILQRLQENSRISNVALAKSINLSPTPCLERVRKLEREGFIKKYVALADPIKLNYGLAAYIQVSLTHTATSDLTSFGRQMKSMPEVLECHMVAGGFDFLIKIRVADMQSFQSFLGEKLATISIVAETHTYMVIKEVKSETALFVSD